MGCWFNTNGLCLPFATESNETGSKSQLWLHNGVSSPNGLAELSAWLLYCGCVLVYKQINIHDNLPADFTYCWSVPWGDQEEGVCLFATLNYL